MPTVQVNLAQAFNLRVAVGRQFAMFGLRRGLNWVDDSLRETPEYKAFITRLELPIEAVQAQLVDPVRGVNGGVPVNADAAVAQAKANAERAVFENKEYERKKKEDEAAAKEEAKSIDQVAAEAEEASTPKRKGRK